MAVFYINYSIAPTDKQILPTVRRYKLSGQTTIRTHDCIIINHRNCRRVQTRHRYLTPLKSRLHTT